MDATTLGKLAQDVAAANEGQLHLSIAGVNTDDVTFLSFDSDGHSLSSDYRFNFMLELTTVLDLTKVIGSAAYFEVTDNDEPVYIHGIITEATYLGSRTDGETYYISMNSMLNPLKNNRQNRVYLNKHVKQIVQDVLEDAQFNNAEFEFKTQGEYPLREFTVQYDESDYDFIQRLLAYEGMFFTFEQKADGAKLIIYDNIVDVPAFELGELTYETQSGQVRSMQTVYNFNRHSRMITDNVKFKDYNYRTPEASLEAIASRSTNTSGQGTDYRYGENYKTLDDGDRIAKLRQEALDWPREVYVADTNCRALVPGQKFTLTNHPNESLNGDYYIVRIEHQGDQSGALAYGSLVSGMLYKSQLTLVKAGIPYRAALPARRYRHGVFTAKVETTGGDYAYLDEQGRYHVRLPFDLSMQPEGEASHPVRQAQTYSGMEYGMHFPLHAGTEVILTSVNGDVDRPIMLGALHNPELPNLVTSKNNSHNLLRSWGDNELLMEDRKGEERIDLFTRERKNSLKLNAKSGAHKVYLGTEEGEMEQYAAKTMLIESGDTQTIQSGNDHILTIENSHSLHTEKKQIEYKAKTDIRFKAGNNISLSSETQNVEMKAGKDMIIDVNNNMSLEVRNKNLNIVCKSGNFEIKAAKAITVKGQGGGNINISQAGGSVVIDTGGAIAIKGTTVNIDGNAVYLKGATAKEGGGGSGGGASGSGSGSDISKLSLAALDVFNHVVRKAQDIAATINSPMAKEQMVTEDLTVDQEAVSGDKFNSFSAVPVAVNGEIIETEVTKVVTSLFFVSSALKAPYINDATKFKIGIKSIFGDDIPTSAIEQFRLDLKSGSYKKAEFQIDKSLSGDTYGYYKDGVIYLSEELVKAAKDDPEKRWLLMLVMLEETGHHLDYLLRTVYSKVGGDAKGDEGTRYSADFLHFNHLIDSNVKYASFMFVEKTNGQVSSEKVENYSITKSDLDREKRAKYLLYVEDNLSDQGQVKLKDGSVVTVEFFKIRGAGAVHEDITESAAEKAGVKFDTELDEGCAWPDVPCNNPNSVETCYAKTYFNMDKKGTMAYRSHHGDLQYWHSMAPDNNMTNLEVRNLIIVQAKKWFTVALESKRIFHVGKILHTVQDSYSRSHVERVEKDDVLKRLKKNQVIRFQNYDEQDEKRHAKADVVVNGSWKHSPGAIDARDVSAKILLMYKEKAPVEELEKYLLEVVYPFAPGAEASKAGGSLDSYSKS